MMRNYISIVLGIVGLIGIIFIVKNKIFTNSQDDLYDIGWKEYQNGEFQKSINYLSKLDIKEYPEAAMALGDSYFEIQDYKNAQKYLQGVYDKNLLKDKNKLNILTNMLGICNIELRDYKKARYFLDESSKLGNSNSNINLKILDSLEQKKK